MKTIVIFVHGTLDKVSMPKKNIISMFSEACANEYLILQDGPNTFGTNLSLQVNSIVKQVQEYLQNDPEIKQVLMVGFSRGAVACFQIANHLNALQQNNQIAQDIQGHFFAIDPVAGPGDKGHLINREIPPFVKRGIITLQEHEQRIFLTPQDKSRIVIKEPHSSSIIFLPLYGAHSEGNRLSDIKIISEDSNNDSAIIVWHLLHDFMLAHGATFKNDVLPEFAIWTANK